MLPCLRSLTSPPGACRARLLPVGGGPAIEIVGPLTVLGRRSGCDVRLDAPTVSKAHCALVWTNGQLLLRDLCSHNGTKVNGNRVHEVALANNDQINIAGCLFVVCLEDEASLPLQDVDATYRLN
jgi:pSer/pThr/pTyr-binding forkhead associated (FHA) protein